MNNTPLDDYKHTSTGFELLTHNQPQGHRHLPAIDNARTRALAANRERRGVRDLSALTKQRYAGYDTIDINPPGDTFIPWKKYGKSIRISKNNGETAPLKMVKNRIQRREALPEYHVIIPEPGKKYGVSYTFPYRQLRGSR